MSLPKEIWAKLIHWKHRASAHNELLICMHKAKSLLGANDYAGARNLLLQALDLRQSSSNPELSEQIITWLGWTWFAQERFEEEIKFFTDYTRSNPNSAASYRERATAFWYIGALEKAVHDYTLAMELDPDEFRPLCGRGQVLVEMGKYDLALNDLNRALEILNAAPRLDPAFENWYVSFEAYTRNGRGLALASLGEHQPAMAEFEASIKLSPENAWVFFNRASAHELAGNKDKALVDYKAALQKSGPRLNSLKRQRAMARIQDLSGA